MKTKEELLKQHAQQIAELDKEIELTAMLPIYSHAPDPTKSLCWPHVESPLRLLSK